MKGRSAGRGPKVEAFRQNGLWMVPSSPDRSSRRNDGRCGSFGWNESLSGIGAVGRAVVVGVVAGGSRWAWRPMGGTSRVTGTGRHPCVVVVFVGAVG